jgi:hypothetical protein
VLSAGTHREERPECRESGGDDAKDWRMILILLKSVVGIRVATARPQHAAVFWKGHAPADYGKSAVDVYTASAGGVAAQPPRRLADRLTPRSPLSSADI